MPKSSEFMERVLFPEEGTKIEDTRLYRHLEAAGNGGVPYTIHDQTTLLCQVEEDTQN